MLVASTKKREVLVEKGSEKLIHLLDLTYSTVAWTFGPDTFHHEHSPLHSTPLYSVRVQLLLRPQHGPAAPSN